MENENEGVTLVSSEKFDTCGNEALGGAAFAEGVLFLAAAVLREENGVAKADAFFIIDFQRLGCLRPVFGAS